MRGFEKVVLIAVEGFLKRLRRSFVKMPEFVKGASTLNNDRD